MIIGAEIKCAAYLIGEYTVKCKHVQEFKNNARKPVRCTQYLGMLIASLQDRVLNGQEQHDYFCEGFLLLYLRFNDSLSRSDCNGIEW